MVTTTELRIGYVPEHFSTPIHFATKHHGLQAHLTPFPSGTGHMITALRAGEIDIAIGLTEAWAAGLGAADAPGDGGYRFVGTFVETPLCWAISTGAERPEINSVAALQGAKIGVSRIGSGSYVMGYVLADRQSWLSSPSPDSSQPRPPYSDFVVLHSFDKLREAVNNGSADFFMWEYFTSKRYYDSGAIRRVGEIYTPWSGWKIVASTRLVSRSSDSSSLDPRIDDLLTKLDQGITHFNAHPDEAVDYISTHLDYSEADAREWLGTVRFAARTRGVDVGVVEKTVETLRQANVLTRGKGMAPREMVAVTR